MRNCVLLLLFAIQVGGLLCSSPAHAIVKCELDGKVSYRDTPCPSGRSTALNEAVTVTPDDVRQAQARALHDKKILTRIEQDQGRERERAAQAAAQAQRQTAQKKRHCEKLALHEKWLAEELRHAKPRSIERVKRQTQKAREEMALDCPSAIPG